MARPKKEINWDIVEKKMEAGCSAKEICGSTLDTDTFYRRFKEEYGKSFGDYSAEFYSVGNGNLKFTQYMKALSGNTNMLTLLGKERLGQGNTEISDEVQRQLQEWIPKIQQMIERNPVKE